MNKLLKGISVLVACMTLSPAAFAQAANGNGSCAQRVDISYYKIERGRQDEWLGLYRKWHRKVMLYEIAHGMALSYKLYEAGGHAPGMPWDFAIINVYPVKAPPHPISRPDLIRKVTAADVQAAAREWLDKKRSVTGYLIKDTSPQPERRS